MTLLECITVSFLSSQPIYFLNRAFVLNSWEMCLHWLICIAFSWLFCTMGERSKHISPSPPGQLLIKKEIVMLETTLWFHNYHIMLIWQFQSTLKVFFFFFLVRTNPRVSWNCQNKTRRTLKSLRHPPLFHLFHKTLRLQPHIFKLKIPTAPYCDPTIKHHSEMVQEKSRKSSLRNIRKVSILIRR